MLTVPSSITNAAQSGSATPAVRVRLRNRFVSGAHRLAWTHVYAGGEPAGPVATVVTASGASVTARTDGTAVYVRRLATPGASAAWDTWTAVVAGAVAGTPVALATFGPVVALYYNASGNTIACRISRDDGVTWDPVVAGPSLGAGVQRLAAAVSGDATGAELAGGVVLAAIAGPDVRAIPIANDWTLAATSTGWGQSATAVSGVAVAYQRDFEVVVTGTTASGENAWGLVYGAGNQAAAGTWSARWELAASDVATVAFARPFLANIDGHLRFGWEENRTTTVARRTVMASYVPDAAVSRWIDEGIVEPAPVLAAPNRDLALAGAGAVALLVASYAVYLAALGQEATVTTPDLLELRLDLEPGREHATFVLADEPALDPLLLEPGLECTIGFGYGDEVVDVATFEVESVELTPGRRRFEATGIPEALARWRSRHARTFAAGTKTIYQHLAWLSARAGLKDPVLAVAGSTTMTTAQPALVLAPRETAAAATRRLLALVPEIPHHLLGGLRLTNPLATDAPAYAALGDTHAILSRRYTTRTPAVNRALVASPAGVDERFDADLVALVGAREAASVDDRALATATLLTAAGDALLREGALSRHAGHIAFAPHPGLEVADVVTLTDPLLPGPTPRRIAALHLRYRAGPQGEYVQEAELAGV